ncbi:hypothetical protein CALVIDRAFT_568752 [Calocera viscosa TUFC12733]|uniref:Uncharacterized protein n=1 Tax=Calocera viscosa (strain TUFC12733) TaxID=1330018 RepID=A0A167GPS1_CALVF|nr:hypothetical protein CALVIDRAFT_568752 [Calocera viscosa TUFC12733]
MVSVKLLSLFAILFVNVGLASAKALTNGERLARGMPLAKPKRLFEPSRVQHAKRSDSPGVTYNSPVGITSTTITFPDRKRDEIAPRQGVSVPDFDYYIAPLTGNPTYAPGVTVTTNPTDAISLTYTFGGETTFAESSPPNSYYMSVCCQPTSCWINPDDGSYVILAWTYEASPAGFYPGGPIDGDSQESCSNLESTIFTVDGTTGQISIQYTNPTSSAFYPPDTSIPTEQEPFTYVVLYNNYFYLTANPALTAIKLGGGAIVSMYVNIN